MHRQILRCLALGIFVAACHTKSGSSVEEGPAERAGRSIDETAQQIAEGAEEVWDITKEGVRKGTLQALQATERGAASLQEKLEPEATPVSTPAAIEYY